MKGLKMKIFVKTIGWLVVSGLVIFIGNIMGGCDLRTALYGAFISKIGTTLIYPFYEKLFEKKYAHFNDKKIQSSELAFGGGGIVHRRNRNSMLWFKMPD
jgi:hypothetical protein